MYRKKVKRETELPKGRVDDVKELIERTAEIMGVKSIVVRDIVDHCLDEMKMWFQEAPTHTLRLHELGSFQLNCKKIRADIIYNVKALKRHRDNPYLEEEKVQGMREKVKKLWKRRNLCLDLQAMKDANQSKFYFSESAKKEKE